MNRRAFFARLGAVGAAAVVPWRMLRAQPRYYRVRYVAPTIVDPATLTSGETTWTVSGDSVYFIGHDGPYMLSDGAAYSLAKTLSVS